jgi:hypothetical protein
MQLFHMPNRLGNRAQCRMDISVPAVRNPDGLCGLEWPEKYRSGIFRLQPGHLDNGELDCSMA